MFSNRTRFPLLPGGSTNSWSWFHGSRSGRGAVHNRPEGLQGCGPERYNFELYAYQFLSWATPELFCHGEFWIEMERLSPILDLGPDRSRKYRDPLRRLLSRLHESGWWHCDVDLVNVVVHPVRGPLLIDWENLREAEGSI